MTEGVKVFKMTECDWVAARNLEEARKPIEEMCGVPEAAEMIDDMDGGYQVSEEAMDKLLVTEEVWPDSDDEEDGSEVEPELVERTFREELKIRLEAGEQVPFVLCSTEY